MAKSYAERLEKDLPKLALSRMTRSLRAGKVLIDWSQNNGAKTTIAPYSLRAWEHPTASTPVTWDEVSGCESPADLFFTAPDVLTRVESMGDLFAPLTPASAAD
jgi:bifunctional non-homologous end joining protein LigD